MKSVGSGHQAVGIHAAGVGLQAAAERERKAAVTRPRAPNRPSILEAEARLESRQADANAQVMLAEASAESIRRVTAGIGDQAEPMMYLLGEKYIAALEARRVGQRQDRGDARRPQEPCAARRPLGPRLNAHPGPPRRLDRFPGSVPATKKTTMLKSSNTVRALIAAVALATVSTGALGRTS